MPNILKDIVGQKFGTLTVLSRAEGTHEAKWLCRCDCGYERVYVGGKLRRGDARCKCDSGMDRNGLASAEPDLHRVWSNMKERCRRPENSSYHRYGGRGISVCKDWLLSFTEFCRWAKTHGWEKGLQLDRIDNDGNYEPSNCRFVTPQQNCRNKSRNRHLEFRGEIKLMVEWAEILDIPMKTIHARIRRRGWSVERALSTPKQSVAEAARNRIMGAQL